MRIVVGVLRGGPSSEYEVSLQSGANVINELNREKYEPRDVFITRDGQWHVHGKALDPHIALRGVDVAFNVLHGHAGEDGTLHDILDTHGVPYTGSRRFPSMLAYNKQMTKDTITKLGIPVKTARGVTLSPEEDIEAQAIRLFRSFPMPAVVKPVVGGSSIGVTLARSFDDLVGGLHHAYQFAPRALVEEYIKGREATVGVIDHFRNERAYVLPPVEMIPPKSADFFDYQVKYDGTTQEICPGNFSEIEKRALMEAARAVHLGLELSHYSRSEFIVSPRGVYFLEINNAAGVGMTKESLLPKALKAVGASVSDFLDHIITLALGKK